MTIRNYKNGWIEVICGSMYAGKSTELLRRIELLEHSNFNYQVFTPKKDNRFGKDIISNHNGASHAAHSVSNWKDIESYLKSDTTFIIIDEIQLFNKDIIPFLSKLAKTGKNIIVAGLTLDFRGNPFTTTMQLLARSEFIKKLESICKECNAPASRSQRTSQGKPASANEATVLIGANDIYQPVCRSCHEVPDYEWWKEYN